MKPLSLLWPIQAYSCHKTLGSGCASCRAQNQRTAGRGARGAQCSVQIEQELRTASQFCSSSRFAPCRRTTNAPAATSVGRWWAPNARTHSGGSGLRYLPEPADFCKLLQQSLIIALSTQREALEDDHVVLSGFSGSRDDDTTSAPGPTMISDRRLVTGFRVYVVLCDVMTVMICRTALCMHACLSVCMYVCMYVCR